MLLWLGYIVVTLVFFVAALGSIHPGGIVIWLLLPAIAGSFILNAVACWRMFLNPRRGLRNAYLGLLLILPFFAYASMFMLGLPLVILLPVMYYTKVMIRRNPSRDHMLRYSEPWRIKIAGAFWGAFWTFVLYALLLNCYSSTSNIFPIVGNGITFWR